MKKPNTKPGYLSVSAQDAANQPQDIAISFVDWRSARQGFACRKLQTD
jgi:hypothetical protein